MHRSIRQPIRLHDALAIVAELRKYDDALFAKPRWLVMNKLDLVDAGAREQRIAEFLKGYGPVERHFAVSAITGEGCGALCGAVMDHLERRRASAGIEAQADETP